MTGRIFTACVLVVIFRSISMFADGPPVSCCLRHGDRRPHLDKILNYRIQTEELCPIRAVLFQTVAGKTLCSKPESSWTKSAMWKVDEEQRKLREQDPEALEGASVDERKGEEHNSRNTTKQQSYNNNADD
ncbi:monocyte chemotactic protein 1B-like [Danio rerio]|uniref:Monocyte chemotactic protein 1B-like n=1 Tax=Danio rerio TaxID=7955 RepID=A0AC58I431_DANRE